MKNILIGAFFFLAAVLQMSFFPNFFPPGTAPDIILVIIIIWTIRYEFNIVLKWAIFGGLLLDLASFYPIGTNIVSMVASSFFVNSLGKRFLVAQPALRILVFVVMVSAASFISHSIILVLMAMSDGQGSVSILSSVQEYLRSVFHRDSGLRIISNLLMFVLMYRPLGKIDRMIAYYGKK